MVVGTMEGMVMEGNEMAGKTTGEETMGEETMGGGEAGYLPKCLDGLLRTTPRIAIELDCCFGKKGTNEKFRL